MMMAQNQAESTREPINYRRFINQLPPDIIISYLPTPPLCQDMTQGQFFKRSLAGLNSELSFS